MVDLFADVPEEMIENTLQTIQRNLDRVGLYGGHTLRKHTDIQYVERQLGRSTTNEGIEDGKITTQELRPKTRNSVRTVSLADFVIDEIILQRQKYEELRDNFSDFQDYGYLCCQDNGLPYNRSFARNSYIRLLEKCGFEKIPFEKIPIDEGYLLEVLP